MTMARLQYMAALWKAGLLQMRGLYAYVLGLGTSIVALSALSIDSLPESMQRFHHGISEAGKWAVIAGIVLKTIQAQAKPVVPPAPLSGAPSLLDDERDGDARA